MVEAMLERLNNFAEAWAKLHNVQVKQLLATTIRDLMLAAETPELTLTLVLPARSCGWVTHQRIATLAFASMPHGHGNDGTRRTPH